MRRFKKPKPLAQRRKSTPVAVSVVPRWGVIAGFPDFWQTVHDRYPAFFAAAHDLPPLVNRFLAKPISGPLGIVLHFLTAIVTNSFGALITLGLNGYGHDAVRIARGMFEAAVNAAYLKLHPTEVDDYLDYHWVRQKRLHDYFQQYSPSDLANVPPGTITQIHNEFAEVVRRFTGPGGRLRRSWCKKDLRTRAQEVGLEQFYPTFYASASGIHHGDIGGLIAQSAKDALKVELAPSLAEIEGALRMGHHAVLHVLHSFNEAASLGMGEELETARNAFLKAWKS